MKVASEKSWPSSMTSSSPILSFKLTLGAYYKIVRIETKFWRACLTW